MRGTVSKLKIVDWLVIKDPSRDQRWALHLPFMFSSWGCLYGRGKCPGMIFNDSQHYSYDTGCCNDGAYLTDPQELKEQQFWVDQLTDDDMPARKLEEVHKRWLDVTHEADGSVSARTRVFEGACIFANKFGEQKDGKIGCAFLHLAARLGEKDITQASHTLTMPTVCWQLPIKIVPDEDEYGPISQIVPWDASRWTEEADPEFDDLSWWCVSEGTLITTERGLVPIEEISEEHDRVLTRQGWRKVVKRWDNGERPCIEVVYEGGTIVVTEDHKLLTTTGWLSGREIVARTAHTVSTVRANVGVLGRVPVAVRTGVTPPGGEGFAADYILTAADALKVFDVAANPVPAQMVQLVAAWDRATDSTPDVDCETARDAVQLRHSVAAASPLTSERDTIERVDEIGLDEGVGVNGRHVLNVHQVGVRRVYDLTVEEVHEYVASGVVVHNCVDDKEAYSHETEPFFRRYAVELETIVGPEAWWGLILPELEKRFATLVTEPMPAAGPQGRTLIPLVVKNRIEQRPRP